MEKRQSRDLLAHLSHVAGKMTRLDHICEGDLVGGLCVCGIGVYDLKVNQHFSLALTLPLSLFSLSLSVNPNLLRWPCAVKKAVHLLKKRVQERLATRLHRCTSLNTGSRLTSVLGLSDLLTATAFPLPLFPAPCVVVADWLLLP